MNTENVILGIDLGTGNSVASLLQNGKPEVIINSNGDRTTPSIVAYTEDGKIVGKQAKRQAVTNPTNTLYEVKRLIGKNFSDEDVQEFKQNATFKIIEGENDSILIEVEGKKLSPVEVSASVLSEMKKIGEDYLGQEVKDAVITVPARFNQQQREATKDAATIAGLNTLRLINEPTAAILSLGNFPDKGQKFFVVDYGSGTFDCSLLSVEDNVFEVLSSDGFDNQGGKDLDQVIIDWLVEEFEKLEGINLKEDKTSMQRLKEAAEEAKCQLSTSLEADINLPFITSSNTGPKHLNMKLSRAKFENMVRHIIDKLIGPCKNILKETKTSKQDIDEVILVGGSCRIPIVQHVIEEFFDKKANKTLDPDLAISMGAAVQGGIMSGKNSELLLLDCTSLSLSIETLGGLATKIIEKNTTIPVSQKQTFSTHVDNQDSCTIHIVQGEREMAKDNSTLGRFDLQGIPPAPRGVPQIEVTMSVSADSILTVSAKDLGTGKEQSITIKDSGSLPEEEIERMIKDAEEHAESDRKKRELVDTRNQAESTIFQVEKSLEENEGSITEEEKAGIEKNVEALKEVLTSEDKDVIKEAMDKLNNSFHAIAEKLYAKQQEAAPDINTEQEDVMDAEFEEKN